MWQPTKVLDLEEAITTRNQITLSADSYPRGITGGEFPTCQSWHLLARRSQLVGNPQTLSADSYPRGITCGEFPTCQLVGCHIICRRCQINVVEPSIGYRCFSHSSGSYLISDSPVLLTGQYLSWKTTSNLSKSQKTTSNLSSLVLGR